MTAPDGLRTILQSRAVLVLALLYLAFSLVITLSWQFEALEGIDARCGVEADLPDLQESSRAGAAAALSLAGASLSCG